MGCEITIFVCESSGELKTLDKLVEYIAAEEAGNAEASDLMSDSNIVGGIRGSPLITYRKTISRSASNASSLHMDQTLQGKERNPVKPGLRFVKAANDHTT